MDPIERLGQWLQDSGLATATTIAALRQEIDAEVLAAVDLAKAAPLPAADGLGAHLHA
jgi:TPP-dependent pyruvate/acetoin dehydrogenase alpha subunit